MPNKRWGKGEGGRSNKTWGRGSKIFLIKGGGGRVGILKNPLISIMNEKKDINV